jgi:hypothetical protein
MNLKGASKRDMAERMKDEGLKASKRKEISRGIFAA